ncbi:hypothetical protein R1flu_013212 [Riccia fluitans]|uniref:Rad60/SUMO-like domain-containing protein n=1 Tax=Riccia fluitans TaxID=41844 RepID=A0ABD1YCM1_9MARC
MCHIQAMAGVKLEPLFDYSRVTPTITLDDSDDEDLEILDKIEVKGRWRPTPRPLQVIQSNIEGPVVPNVVKSVEDDDDWLTLPARVSVPAVQPPDPHILQLRQQKEEFLKLSILIQLETARVEAQASEEMERKAKLASEESPVVSNGLGAGGTPSSREKITLQLQEQGGKIHVVKIFYDDTFEKLLAIFSEKIAKRPSTDFILRFDGTTIDPRKTPKGLELEDEDMIEIHMKTSQARKRN